MVDVKSSTTDDLTNLRMKNIDLWQNKSIATFVVSKSVSSLVSKMANQEGKNVPSVLDSPPYIVVDNFNDFWFYQRLIGGNYFQIITDFDDVNVDEMFFGSNPGEGKFVTDENKVTVIVSADSASTVYTL